MSYSVKKDDHCVVVVEKDTELIVYKTKKETDARSLCRSLNLGSGFAGVTPNFFAVHK